jgi:hypothetical protein
VAVRPLGSMASLPKALFENCVDQEGPTRTPTDSIRSEESGEAIRDTGAM